MTTPRYILTLSCHDVRGIVAAVATFLAEHDGFILESAQFGDETTNRFFLRMEFTAGLKTPALEQFKALFESRIAQPFSMQWQLHDKAHKSRVLVMVSRHSHCLNDLLHRYATGLLPVEIPCVISNHTDLQKIVEWHGIPFIHLPVTPETKELQEIELLKIIDQQKIDLVVLARYMQILSGKVCEAMPGRIINIHHSFLPSFKGANPYGQAYERGVKIIGATAHFVTQDLDEGPIIEQEVGRVDHTFTPDMLTGTGRDIECLVLARALKYYIEHRVLLNGHKTVIFR